MDRTELLDRIRILKDTNDVLYTNIVLSDLENRDLNVYSNEKAIVATYIDNSVTRLVYYYSNSESLRYLLDSLPSGDYVIEKVERTGFESDDDIESIGIRFYTRLHRYINNNIGDYLFVNNAPVTQYKGRYESVVLESAYFERIKTLLKTTFDPNISHLPDDDMLSCQISAGEYVGIVDNGEIVSLLQRKLDKNKFYINQVINKGTKDCIHALMLNEICDFVEAGGNRIYSWIEESNIASIKFHSKYGLVKDGTYVNIYTWHID